MESTTLFIELYHENTLQIGILAWITVTHLHEIYSSYNIIQMGSNLNKDQKCIIYMTLNKRVTTAGQPVEGLVHINCLTDRPYQQLNIRVDGFEHIHWSEHHQKRTVHYESHRETYTEEFLLAKFPGGLRMGHYSFPFSLLLPIALPASFEHSSDNHIRYNISAYLPAFDGNSQIQMCKRPLHVRQPLRTPPVNIAAKYTTQSKCCGCCCSGGFSQISFETNINQLFYLQPFDIRGTVKNLSNGTKIKKYKVVLRERVKRVCEQWNRVQQYADDYVLFESVRNVEANGQDFFTAQVKVPKDILGYTAIGSIISRFYSIVVIGQVGCCYSNFQVEAHTVFNTSVEPPLDKADEIMAPQGWNPVVAAPIAFVNMRPYVYNPNPYIVVRNQPPGVSSLNNLNAMTSNQLQGPLY